MSKDLIIVESPAKAKTIKNFLEGKYNVIASRGHIRDIIKYSLGVKIENGKVNVKYEVTPDHKEVVNDIKRLAKDANVVYIATDEDREGEAIGYHITEILGGDVKTYPRIVFHEITKKAITHALETPRTIDMNKVNAQQARRVLDRVIGFTLSGLLQLKIKKGLSAGRVQSSTLGILVDRENEIRSFQPVKYFAITCDFDKQVVGELVSFKNQKVGKLDIKTQEEVNEVKRVVDSEQFEVKFVEYKIRNVKPLPPFVTSTLQQAASTKFNFPPAKTMQIAQKLYEGVETPWGVSGAITYMRTDSFNIAEEAQDAAIGYIKSVTGSKANEYVPQTKNSYVTKAKGAQEAHEAIRPTNLAYTPEVAKKFLDADHYKVYELIFNRFIASQSTPAQFGNLVMLIGSENATFRAVGSTLIFDGFQKFSGSESKDKVIPSLQEGHKFNIKEMTAQEKQTEPPSRYSEASLVKMMEDVGIGRPSTYASTIALLLNRGYVKKDGKVLVPTEDAFTVIDLLKKHFNYIVDTHFTAEVENELDKIAMAEVDWEKMVSDFNTPFEQKIKEGKENIASQKVLEKTGEKCPKCGEDLVYRQGKFGKFISCSAFPKCKFIKPKDAPETKPQQPSVETNVTCPKCKKNHLVQREGKYGSYYSCKGFPKCKFISKELPIANSSCSKCNGYLVIKNGKEHCPKCDGKKFFKKKK